MVLPFSKEGFHEKRRPLHLALFLDGRIPLKQGIPLGLQHVLSMFVGNLSPLLNIIIPKDQAPTDVGNV